MVFPKPVDTSTGIYFLVSCIFAVNLSCMEELNTAA